MAEKTETGDKKFDCYKCKHRDNIPGDVHSCCNYPGTKTGFGNFFEPENKETAIKLNIKGDPYGIRSGWFMWPVNFDPVWLRNCDGFEQKQQKEERQK